MSPGLLGLSPPPPVGCCVPLPPVGWEVGACDLVRVGCVEDVERPESVGSEEIGRAHV